MNIPSYLQSQPTRIILFVIGLACILTATFTIYDNLKKDTIGGRGSLSVSRDCHHVGPWDDDFECTGEYTQGGGMVSVKDAVVRVTGNYSKGSTIDDIYRDQSISYDAPASQQRYISGEDRRSLLHNLPYVIIVQIGLFITIWALLPKRRVDS